MTFSFHFMLICVFSYDCVGFGQFWGSFELVLSLTRECLAEVCARCAGIWARRALGKIFWSFKAESCARRAHGRFIFLSVMARSALEGASRPGQNSEMLYKGVFRYFEVGWLILRAKEHLCTVANKDLKIGSLDRRLIAFDAC